jgi:serine/threonine-protein kinase
MSVSSDRSLEVRPGQAVSPLSGGRVFGKFQLLANLGTGGMGEVFLAMARGGLGVRKLVVIKRLKHFAEDAARDEAQEMFLNEARLATLLNHSNIVQTNDVGVEDGHMYLVMEYLEGQSLNAISRHMKTSQRRVDDGILAKMVSEALCGLHYAHELRDYDGKPLSIVHRDLSPHNIFVTYEGVIKIVDFGIAKTSSSAKTEQGIIKGKFAYMAPEQAGDDKVDRRADVFVMGIVLWELLTGERLVYRRNEVQTIHRLLNETFDPVSSVRADVDPRLDAIVTKALSKDPAARYQTAQEMREALETFLVSGFRPVRQEEIGTLVSDLFRADRSAIQQKIQDCVAAATEEPDPDHLPALTVPSEVTPNAKLVRQRAELRTTGNTMISGSLAALTTGPDSANDVTAPSPDLSAPRAGKSRVAAMAAVAFVLVSVFAVAVVSRGRPAPSASSAEVAAPQSPPPAATQLAVLPPSAPTASVDPAPSGPSAKVEAAPAHAPHASPPVTTTRARASTPAPRAPLPPAGAPTAAAPAATSHQRVFNTQL